MNAQQLPTADFEEICTLDRVLAKPTKNHGSKVRLEGRYTTLYGPTDIDKARTIIEWRVVGRVDEPQS
jgi:hypothetical protein